MRVGDKKQAVLLSVVAVGALGFMVFQLIGTLQGGGRPHGRTGDSSLAGDPVAVLAADYPLLVTRDAFSHPKLEVASKKQGGVETGGNSGPVNSSPSAEHLPAAIPTDPKWLQSNPELPDKPEEIAGKTNKENEAPSASIKLLATMRASGWRAVVQIGTGASVVVEKGQALMDGVRVSTISDEGISVIRGTKTSNLAVGEEAKL